MHDICPPFLSKSEAPIEGYSMQDICPPFLSKSEAHIEGIFHGTQKMHETYGLRPAERLHAGVALS